MRMTPRTGDWILTHGSDSLIARLIRKLTFGKVNHAMIVYSEGTVFETDGSWFKAKFNPITRYVGKEIYLIRPMFYYDLDAFEKVQALCKKYEGAPYSYWDIITNGSLFWLNPPIREKIIRCLSNKTFMICSELVGRITYEVTGQKLLADWEGFDPQDLLDIALKNPNLFSVENGLL